MDIRPINRQAREARGDFYERRSRVPELPYSGSNYVDPVGCQYIPFNPDESSQRHHRAFEVEHENARSRRDANLEHEDEGVRVLERALDSALTTKY